MVKRAGVDLGFRNRKLGSLLSSSRERENEEEMRERELRLKSLGTQLEMNEQEKTST